LAIHKYAPNNLFKKIKKREKSNFTRTGGETYSVVAVETTGSGDERRRRRERREGRDERDGAGDNKNELGMKNGNLNLKEKIWFIYITKTASF
jgi:hypothetical protein